jgi:hypothetical protein
MNAERLTFSLFRHPRQSSAGIYSKETASRFLFSPSPLTPYVLRLTPPDSFTSLKGCGPVVPVLQSGPTTPEPR